MTIYNYLKPKNMIVAFLANCQAMTFFKPLHVNIDQKMPLPVKS